MTPDDLTRRLQRLHEAGEKIATNLVDLEVNSERQLVEASSLAGRSAASWTAGNASLTELWRRKGLFEELLEQADDLRDSGRDHELRELLTGRSIELASADVPLAERDLLGRARKEQCCSVDELLESMSRAFDEVKTVVAEISGAWETLIPKLDAARHLLAETTRLAEDLAEPGRRDLASAAQALGRLGGAVTTDPLSVPASEIDGQLSALQAIRADLEGSAELKRGFDGRMHAARELLGELESIVRDGAIAHDELVLKISVPDAPPAPAIPEGLDVELSAIADMGQHGAWREARHAIEAWTANVQRLLSEAKRSLEANRAPIQARNQFRALLDAYQVKAKRLGLLEDPELTEVFDQARAELYSAPTDLGRAAQLVRVYQRALSGPATREVLR
jgi:hypothetical protein